MGIYRQTTKSLDILLSRDERLVYSLCREAISDVVLAQRTQLAHEAIDKALSTLVAHGLIERIDLSHDPQNRSSNSQPIASAPDPLVEAKTRLASVLTTELGNQAAKFLPEIESKKDLRELEEWSRKLILKLRLTMSQKAADSLEARLKSLFT
ncbi:MAG: hypothetical protein KatS3mg075_758 [Meiothermus sp.]|jgi:hypothetical protein|uniref:Uncharacterized protein n=1 Tax=Meiothermus ruber TaxID=277 RepID=A0A7C3DSB7_MEIRU|nr:MAG: hypothetical protein KatS3mg075_758 [Meiothermus sp.]